MQIQFLPWNSQNWIWALKEFGLLIYSKEMQAFSWKFFKVSFLIREYDLSSESWPQINCWHEIFPHSDFFSISINILPTLFFLYFLQNRRLVWYLKIGLACTHLFLDDENARTMRGNRGLNQKRLTLMIPGKSTSTMRCKPGPFTVIDMTSVLTVLPFLTLFNILSSTCHKKQKESKDWEKLVNGWCIGRWPCLAWIRLPISSRVLTKNHKYKLIGWRKTFDLKISSDLTSESTDDLLVRVIIVKQEIIIQALFSLVT